MQKLNLNTDYKTTGNETDCALDTLGIAFGFGSSDSHFEYNLDYISDCVGNSKDYWIDTNAETFFRATLTNEQLKDFAENLPAYDIALEEYKDCLRDVDSFTYDETVPAQVELYKEIEKAESDISDDVYNTWLNGDRNNVGLRSTANRYFSDYNIKIADGGQGTVTAEIEKDTLQSLIDACELDESATEADVYEWIERTINNKAFGVFQKESARLEARREENKRVAEYKEKQKAEAIERKRKELLALIK